MHDLAIWGTSDVDDFGVKGILVEGNRSLRVAYRAMRGNRVEVWRDGLYLLRHRNLLRREILVQRELKRRQKILVTPSARTSTRSQTPAAAASCSSSCNGSSMGSCERRNVP